MRSHGFRFRGQYEEEIKQELDRAASRSRRASPARTPQARRCQDGETRHHGSRRPRPRRGGIRRQGDAHLGQRGRAPRPRRSPTSTSSPAIRSGPTTRSCRPSPRRSPTASSSPSTSWPRASTASSRSSSTPPPWARACSAAPPAWAGCTRWSAWRSPPPLRVPMVCMVGNRALDDPGAFGVEHNDALVVRDLGWMLSGSTPRRRRSTPR